MANCRYCGKPAGLLRSSHAECEERQQKRERVAQGGRQRIATEVVRAIKGTGSLDELETAIAEIERTSIPRAAERNTHSVRGWESAVEQFLEDRILDAAEEAHRLAEFRERFSLSQSELDRSGSLTRDRPGGCVARRVERRTAKAHGV